MAHKELFTTIRTEGAILPSELLQRVGLLDKDLPGLKPTEYGLAPTERINEAIARSWSRMQGLWIALQEERTKVGTDDPAVGLTRERWLLPLFDELGYGQLKPRRTSDDAPISHGHGDVPIHMLGVGVKLDTRTPGVPGAAKRNPHALVQDFLNQNDSALYGFVSNGRTFRLLRDNSSLTRQAYVEFDLEGMFDGEVYPDFTLLWLVCHATRVEGEPPATCYLERWSQAAAVQGARALDRLREGVKEALVALGSGFLRHPASLQLREGLSGGSLTKQDYYRELLRIVYRLLFLFVAEDRGVLHPPEASGEAKARYAKHFSTRRLRELARRHRGGRHPDLWNSFQLILHSLGDPDGLAGLGLPSLGGIFDPGQTPDTDAAQIANHEFLTAIRALAFTSEGRVVRPIDYKNLGPEEFGSVYESLLELHPEVDVDAGNFAFVEAGGSERKTTGSYYTPPSLVQALLDSALEPVLEQALSGSDPTARERAILKLRVVDPASGSGHFLIAAAHRIAQKLASVRTGESSPATNELSAALRDVVSHCIYGVDVNPMAVELCKVSLWIEAVEPGKPLSFLNHHIRCGNSLVGTTPDLIEAGIPLDAFKPKTGDDKEIAKRRRSFERKRQDTGTTFQQGIATGRLIELKTEAARVSALPDNTPQEVELKAETYRELVTSRTFQTTASAFDAWCAAFYLPQTEDAPDIGSDTIAAMIAGHPVEPSIVEAVVRSAKQHRYFHWDLEFSDVMRDGGFDCVIGNPPWEKVKLSEKEFFAVRAPEIANATNKAARGRLIRNLHDEAPALFDEFQVAIRSAESESQFLRTSGRYPLGGRGDVNTYVVFAESMRDCLNTRGRLGCILPTGIATDDTTKFLFSDLVNTGSLVSLLGFENEEFIFPGIHHATKFCLLTLAGGAHTEPPEFVFFARQAPNLQEDWRRFRLTVEDFGLLNPNTRTCPIFRSGRDAEITKAIYRRVGVLVDENRPEPNPWGISFMTHLHMANDSHLFRERAELEGEGFVLAGNRFVKGEETYLALYEAKMIHLFDHRFGTYEGQTQAQANQGKLPELTDAQHSDPSLIPLSRYWVHEKEVSTRFAERWSHSWFLGWRDVTGAVVQRTMIASIIPRTGVGHKLPIWFCRNASDGIVLGALLSSLALDYQARQKIGGTSMTYFIVKQLPIPEPTVLQSVTPWGKTPLFDWLLPRALELFYTAWDLEGLALDLGYKGAPFRWDADRRVLLKAELDAAFFHLYGISHDDADYILDTFRIVRENEEKQFGSFRTKEAVLDLYDRMAKAAEAGIAYETVLDPTPAHPSLAHDPSSRPAWATLIEAEVPRSKLELVESPPTDSTRERYVPVVDLKAAAGKFGPGREVDPEGWAELPDGVRPPKDGFIAQVVGRSMEPTISDGAWCLFGPPPAGSRGGKILIVQHRDIADSETGGSFTVKRYRSEKAEAEDALWQHVKIVLEPINPDFEPITLTPDSEGEIRVIGEFKQVIA